MGRKTEPPRTHFFWKRSIFNSDAGVVRSPSKARVQQQGSRLWTANQTIRTKLKERSSQIPGCAIRVGGQHQPATCAEAGPGHPSALACKAAARPQDRQAAQQRHRPKAGHASPRRLPARGRRQSVPSTSLRSAATGSCTPATSSRFGFRCTAIAIVPPSACPEFRRKGALKQWASLAAAEHRAGSAFLQHQPNTAGPINCQSDGLRKGKHL